VSLINEALKRTRDSAYQSIQPPIAPAPQYRYHHGAELRRMKTLMLATALIVVVAFAGIVGFAWHLAAHVQSAQNNLIPDSGNAVMEAKLAAPAIRPAPAPATEPKSPEDQIVEKVMEKIKAEPPAAAVSPKLVLQGITFAKDDHEAMMNGLTVHEGEDIEGARVVTIENRRVKMDFKGQEIILRLP
jgi:cytoskeletal protein RodZ